MERILRRVCGSTPCRQMTSGKAVSAWCRCSSTTPPRSLSRRHRPGLALVRARWGARSARDIPYRSQLVPVPILLHPIPSFALPAMGVLCEPDDEVEICVDLKPGTHIVQVLGICADAPDQKKRIVMEHCSLGSLRQYVADRAAAGTVRRPLWLDSVARMLPNSHVIGTVFVFSNS